MFPTARFHLFGALAATALAVVASVVTLSLRELPPVSFSVLLFAAAPMSAIVASAVLTSRAASERDIALRWAAAGLVLAVVAMLLQLVSFPTLDAGGGPLHTSGDASAVLYLLFHLVFALGVLAGALRLPQRWLPPAFITSAVVVVVVAAVLLPLPALLTEQQEFTPLLVGLEWLLVAVMTMALVAWAVSEGPVSTPLQGWIGVALALSIADVTLNALAAERYDALWWSSLFMRAAAFTVLAAGTLVSTLRQLERLEDYSDAELRRREDELGVSVLVTQRLLENARALAAAVTQEEVVDALGAAAAAVAALPRVLVFGVDEQSGELSILGGRGYDAESWAAVNRLSLQGVPASDAAGTGTAVYVNGHDELLRRYPRLATVGIHRTQTACLAAVPMVVGGRVRGVLAVTGDRSQDWPAASRELLEGLAAQGGQALVRAGVYEHEHSAAEQLQQALLPRVLPQRSDLSLAARYLPGVQDVHVGGDWYDCIDCGERVALVVGDVIGMGLDAATTMGQLRTATRVLTAMDPTPVKVLEGLDDVLTHLGPEEVFATLLYVLVDPAAGSALVARAGHVPPLLAPPGEPARFLGDGGSVPLGAPRVPRVQAAVDLPSGSTLALYSDGLVEWHPDGITAGMADLAARLSSRVRQGPATADSLVDALLTGAPNPRPDDIAVLVAVLTPPITS